MSLGDGKLQRFVYSGQDDPQELEIAAGSGITITPSVSGRRLTLTVAGSGGGGSSDHATLTHLDYASSGHTGFVPSTRTVSAGTGLTGGGALSADRTLSLDVSGVTAASKGSATRAVTLTVDAYGRATALSDVLITPAWSSITGTPTTLSGYGITTPIAIGSGGTGQATASAAFDALAPTTTAEDLIIRRGGTNTRLAAGASEGMTLQMRSGVVTWAAPVIVGLLARGDVFIEGRTLIDVPSCTSTDKP